MENIVQLVIRVDELEFRIDTVHLEINCALLLDRIGKEIQHDLLFQEMNSMQVKYPNDEQMNLNFKSNRMKSYSYSIVFF